MAVPSCSSVPDAVVHWQSSRPGDPSAGTRSELPCPFSSVFSEFVILNIDSGKFSDLVIMLAFLLQKIRGSSSGDEPFQSFRLCRQGLNMPMVLIYDSINVDKD